MTLALSPRAADPSDRMALRRLIGAVAREIDSLAEQGHRLQVMIGAHVAAAGAAEQAVEDAQLIDHLLQHFSGLGEVLRRAAEHTPAAVDVEIAAVLRGLRLDGLGRRLAGAGRLDGRNCSGELELL